MRRSTVWAMLLLAVAASTTACAADTDDYPNDQERIEEALTDAGLESVSVAGGKSWGGLGMSTSVTVTYTTAEDTATDEELATVRQVVWEQYPHRLGALSVQATTSAQPQSYDYTGRELETELGEQDYREDDSSAPWSAQMVLAVVIGVPLVCAWLVYTLVHNRSQRRRYGSPPRDRTPRTPPGPMVSRYDHTARPAPGPSADAAPPHTTWLPTRDPEPAPDPPRPEARPEPPRPTSPKARPSKARPPKAGPPDGEQPRAPKRDPRESGRLPSFEETRMQLNDEWQHLVDRAPKSVPRSAPKDMSKADFVDGWLAERSGVPVEKITEARRTRNTAMHKRDEINLAEMNQALKVLDRVSAGLRKPRR
jgi:hypothetical protein